MPGPNNGQPAPPPGYKLEVNPPPGYVLDNDFSDVPSFLQKSIDLSKVKQVRVQPGPGEEDKVAEVSGNDPYTVNVLDPKWYDKGVLNHELTHTFQNTRERHLNTSAPIEGTPGIMDYRYGDIEGLKAAQKKGKTVSDFNDEQQAEMVMHFKDEQNRYMKKAAAGTLTDQDKRDWYDVQQTYHPFIKQLAEMPSDREDLDRNSLFELLGIQKPVEINRKPEPPGLPSYDTPGLGVLPADKLMGGKSQPTGTKKKK